VAGDVGQRLVHDVEHLGLLLLGQAQHRPVVDEVELGPAAAAEVLRAGPQCHHQAAWVQRHPEVRDDAAQAGMCLRQRAPHVVVVGLGPFVVVRADGVVQQRHAHLGHRQRLGQRVVHLGGHRLALLQQPGVQGLLLEPRVVQRQAEQFAHHLQQGAHIVLTARPPRP
jgi:hypothetical protein